MPATTIVYQKTERFATAFRRKSDFISWGGHSLKAQHLAAIVHPIPQFHVPPICRSGVSGSHGPASHTPQSNMLKMQRADGISQHAVGQKSADGRVPLRRL